MTDFILTPSGLSTQTQEEVKAVIDAKIRATFGINTNTQLSSGFGQLSNIFAELLALQQQVQLSVYRSFDPSAATGVILDQRAALTGSTRDGATSSEVDGLLTFSGVGTMDDGDLIADDNGNEWELANGPHTGPGVFAATFTTVNTGPITALANTPWTLVTVVAGLDSFTNPTDDADPGRDQQSDPQFRVDRQIELYSANVGGLLAIRAVVNKVTGVETCRVYHNPTGPGVDANGIPFKAFNVVVSTNPSTPGAALQQSIFDAILSALGAGGAAYGTDFTGTAEDAEGGLEPIAFDTEDGVDIYVSIVLVTTDTEQSISTNLSETVRTAVLEYAQINFTGLGQNQLEPEYIGIIAALQASGEISGVVNVLVQLSRVAITGPFFNPLEINIRERPSFESGNIVAAVTL